MKIAKEKELDLSRNGERKREKERGSYQVICLR